MWEIPFIWDNFAEDNESEEEASEYEDSSDDDEDEMVGMLKDLMSPGTSAEIISKLKKGGGLKFFVT